MSTRISSAAANAMLAALRTQYANCVIDFYSAQASSADNASIGTYLGTATKNGAAFTPGVSTNGLNFDAPVLNVLTKAAAETWIFTCSTPGIIASFRFRANADTLPDSTATTKVRHDGSVGVGTGDLQMSIVNVVVGQQVTINNYAITLPLM
jgi:hypothetical protein